MSGIFITLHHTPKGEQCFLPKPPIINLYISHNLPQLHHAPAADKSGVRSAAQRHGSGNVGGPHKWTL